ncbi:LysR family transcriptional regulator [Rhizobium sp. BE258]|uniref:helix-turn-helix domain-containing protein n=1 Tax=Rhizobium sp. BE258 TaxID=2817722 RepID=UPI002866ED75|nr:LysR family transcriptional regulator [Rhizobium sp. BE258]MDR7145300.1 hypothetical protein [Rhizobium sp. BE258]
MSVNDLNDRRYFTAVVALGGYSAASCSLGIVRSKLSIRIQKLEDELSAADRALNAQFSRNGDRKSFL